MGETKVYNKKMIAVATILTGILISSNMYKVASTMSLLTNYFAITTAQASFLMSVVNIMGVILGIPAGSLMIKSGSKRLGIYALVSSFVGSFLGAFSHTMALLLFSRFIEGFGLALIGVVGPSILAQWFNEEERGLPMAIWSCWVGLGLFTSLKLANFVTDEAVYGSWQNLWLLIGALLVAVFVLFVVFIPKQKAGAVQKNDVAEKKTSKNPLLNSAAWCLAILFMIYSFGVISISSFSTTYCQEVLNCSLIEANNYTSFLTYGMIAGGFLAGIVLNHCRKHNLLLILSFLINALVFGLMFSYTTSWAIGYMIIGGCALSLTPATIFTIAPKAAFSAESMGVVMGILSTGQNLGGFGVALSGQLLEWFGFSTTAVLLGIVGLAGTLLSIFYVKYLTRRFQ